MTPETLQAVLETGFAVFWLWLAAQYAEDENYVPAALALVTALLVAF